MNKKHWSLLLLIAALFGSSFFFIKLAVQTIPPLTLATGRCVLSAMFLYVVMRIQGQSLPRKLSDWKPLLVLALLSAAVPYTGIAWAQRLIDSSFAGIIFASIPVISVLLGPLFLKDEHYTPARLFGACIGFSGVVLIIGPQALAGASAELMGVLVTLASATCYASGAIYARSQYQVSPIVMATGQLGVASIIFIPISAFVDIPWTIAISASSMASLVVVGVFNTAIPVLLFFRLVQDVGATNANLMSFFMPVTAVLLGVTILGERVPWTAFSGLAVVIFGATMLTGNLSLRRLSRRHSTR